MRAGKKSLVFLAVFVLIVVVTLIVAPSFIDINRYRNDLTDILSRKLNRTVTIQDIRLSFITGLSVIGSSVTIADPHRPQYPLISAPEIRVTFAVLPLVSGHITIRRLTLKNPVITLVRYTDGTLNTDGFGMPAGVSTTPQRLSIPVLGIWFIPIKEVLVRSVTVKDGVFSYFKEVPARKAETLVRLNGVDLDMGSIVIPAAPAPASGGGTLAALAADIRATIADGTVGPVPFTRLSLSGSLKGGTASLSKLKATLFGGDLTTHGTVTLTGNTSGGTLSLSLTKANANELLNAFSTSKDALWGTLDFSGDYTFPIHGFAAGLGGTGKILLTDGYVADFSLRDELAKSLKVPPEALPKELDTGSYDSIVIDYVIHSERVSSDHIAVTAPVFSALASGYVGFDKSLSVAGRVTLNRAATISSLYGDVLSLIGIHGGLLESFPFVVSGTLDHAKFSIPLVGTTEQGITDIFKSFGIPLGK